MKLGTIVVVTEEPSGRPVEVYVERDGQRLDLPAFSAERRHAVDEGATTTLTFRVGVRWESRERPPAEPGEGR